MPDEFPTLEAVAALGVLALLIRTLLVASEMRTLPEFAAELGRSLGLGNRAAALSACNSPTAPALARAASELIAHTGEPPYGPDAVGDLRHEQSELELELSRRGESGRARDLVVLAVLLGAMAFAVVSGLGLGKWFHGLAALASVLLIIGYILRSRLRSSEQLELTRIADAIARMIEAAPQQRTARASLNSIDGGCTSCGETVFLVAHAAALGSALPALGIHELRICKHCGLVAGQADDAAILNEAALQELSVPLDEDGEDSAGDTEHDG